MFIFLFFCFRARHNFNTNKEGKAMATDSSELSCTVLQNVSHAETLTQDTSLKNELIPTPDITPLYQNVSSNDVIMEPQQTIISIPEDTPTTSTDLATSSRPAISSAHHAVDDKPSEVKESATQFAIKLFLKKSKGVFGAISVYLSKPISSKGSKFKTFLSTLKNLVQNTLAKNTPTAKSTSQLSHKSFLRFAWNSITNKRKKIKNSGNLPILPLNFRQRSASETFLNPVKKPELQQMGDFQFAKPKIYECSYCNTRFYKLPGYLKHIRQHAERNPELIRCETCSKAFSSVINKRRHQLQCQKRAIL